MQISTAGGQVLVAVGTGGIASALSKGGSVARAASGSIIAYDAAGNAVGVVQGIYDAAQNGVSIGNGAQVAGGLLELGKWERRLVFRPSDLARKRFPTILAAPGQAQRPRRAARRRFGTGLPHFGGRFDGVGWLEP